MDSDGRGDRRRMKRSVREVKREEKNGKDNEGGKKKKGDDKKVNKERTSRGMNRRKGTCGEDSAVVHTSGRSSGPLACKSVEQSCQSDPTKDSEYKVTSIRITHHSQAGFIWF